MAVNREKYKVPLDFKKLKIGRKYKACKDRTILSLLKPGKVWLAGGAVRSGFSDFEKIEDYDLFFNTPEDKDTTIAALEKIGAKQTYKCPQGFLYSYFIKDKHYTVRGVKVQLICERYYKTAAELLRTFDFTICQFAFDGKVLTATPSALKDTRSSTLNIAGLSYPVASLHRVSKYVVKGYKLAYNFGEDFLRATLAIDPNNLSWRRYID